MAGPPEPQPIEALPPIESWPISRKVEFGDVFADYSTQCGGELTILACEVLNEAFESQMRKIKSIRIPVSDS